MRYTRVTAPDVTVWHSVAMLVALAIEYMPAFCKMLSYHMHAI